MAQNHAQRARLRVEQLEDRQLLAGHITFNALQGVVDVQGTRRNDRVAVSFVRGANLKVAMTGAAHEVAFFPRAAVREVVLHGNGGHDRLVNHTNVLAVQVGGPALDARASAPTPVATGTAPGADGLTADEERILQQTNAYRAGRGLPALVVNPLLQAAAQKRADSEAASDSYFGDGGFPQDITWTGYSWTVLDQNDAVNWGYADPAGQLSDQWWTSPPHQANMLDPSVREIGVGVATSASGKTYGVQCFGRTT